MSLKAVAAQARSELPGIRICISTRGLTMFDVAVHEAGHIVAGMATGMRPVNVCIVAMKSGVIDGVTMFDMSDRPLDTLIMASAGGVAQGTSALGLLDALTLIDRAKACGLSPVDGLRFARRSAELHLTENYAALRSLSERLFIAGNLDRHGIESIVFSNCPRLKLRSSPRTGMVNAMWALAKDAVVLRRYGIKIPKCQKGRIS